MKTLANVTVWTLALLVVVVAGLLATQFVLMATSLDPTDLITVGLEPWQNAVLACVAFIGVAIVTIASLFLWHRKHAKVWGAVLLVVQGVALVWICVGVYREYF
jgi:hypothetical protein